MWYGPISIPPYPGFLNLVSWPTVFCFFLTPGTKRGHLKRRVITAEFLPILHRHLQPNGALHIATDQEQFAQEMLLLLTESGLFSNQAAPDKFAKTNISGITTDIEEYNLKLGKPIYRLHFRK